MVRISSMYHFKHDFDSMEISWVQNSKDRQHGAWLRRGISGSKYRGILVARDLLGGDVSYVLVLQTRKDTKVMVKGRKMYRHIQ
jgi:hypothetical protein